MFSNCQFPITETSITIPGPSGNLEAIIIGPRDVASIKGVAVVCHPHPLYGGTMNNKVVTTVANLFKDLDLGVVRFNFRGIGKSEGSYGESVGEIEDLLAVISWVKMHCLNQPVWLAGFSFGSYIAAKVATRETIEKLILIAPPVNHFDFATLLPFTSPTFVVQGDLDEVVPATEVSAWIKTRKNPPELISLPTATHFFHGHLGKLREALLKSLEKKL